VPLPEDSAGPPTSELLIHPYDPDDEWIVDPAGRGVRVRALSASLLLLVVLGLGFWGGALAEKHHGTGASTASAASALSRFAAARGAGGGAGAGAGFAGFAGAGGAGAAATGTVIGVQGRVLDISDSSGNIVKVTLGPAATVTRTASTGLAGLKVGDTVVVTGSTGTGGAVTATAVRATAQGTTGVGGGGAAAGG
jgi:hypothetical protein